MIDRFPNGSSRLPCPREPHIFMRETATTFVLLRNYLYLDPKRMYNKGLLGSFWFWEILLPLFGVQIGTFQKSLLDQCRVSLFMDAALGLMVPPF